MATATQFQNRVPGLSPLRLVPGSQRTLPFPSSVPRRQWRPAASGRRLLRIALRYGYVTRDLAALAYTHAHPRRVGATHIRDELTQLVRGGYLRRFTRPVDPRSGSRQHVYTATVQAAHVFDDEQSWTPEALKAIANRANNPHRDYDHELGVALLRILWDAGSVSYSDQNDDAKFRFRTIAYWDTPHSFKVRSAGKSVQVRPDSTIILHRHYAQPHRRYVHRIHIEFERTRKNLKRTEMRFHHYQALLRDEQGSVARAIHDGLLVRPTKATAIFVAGDEHHLEQLLSSASTALDLERIRRQRKTDTLPDLWFTSLDQLVSRKPQLESGNKIRMVASIIDPRQLFDEPMFVNLQGESGTLLDLRP